MLNALENLEPKNQNGEVFEDGFFLKNVAKCPTWLCMNCLMDSQDWDNKKCIKCGKDQSFSVRVCGIRRSYIWKFFLSRLQFQSELHSNSPQELLRLFEEGKLKEAMKICHQSLQKFPKSYYNHYNISYWNGRYLHDKKQALHYG